MFGRFAGAGGFRGAGMVRLGMRAARAASRMRHAPGRGHIRCTDLRSAVGEAAGELFRLLEAGGETTLEGLREKSTQKGMVFTAALGWLLREDKIEMKASQGAVTVRLR
jgi:hypothetical protein